MLTRDINHPAPLVPGSPTRAREQQPFLRNTLPVSPNETPHSPVSLVAAAKYALPSFPAATISSVTSVHTRSAHQTETAPFATHRSPPCCASTSSSQPGSLPLPCNPMRPSFTLTPLSPSPLAKFAHSRSQVSLSNQASIKDISYFHFLLHVSR